MIGVFDSGPGGLTVLRALSAALPDRAFLYLGDHAHAPYGNRPADDIFRLTRDAVDRLFGLGCRLVILACNTAAAIGLRRLQREWLPSRAPERRILGVLVPMVETITGMPWMAPAPAGLDTRPQRTVWVFATRRTVESGAYPVEIAKRAPEVSVVQQACPDLAGLIEAGGTRAEMRRLIRGYVGEIVQKAGRGVPDAAILACTHYPLCADLFAEALPPGVGILNQPALAAKSLAAYLARHPEVDAYDPTGPITLLTSGEPARASALGPAFFGRATPFQQTEGK